MSRVLSEFGLVARWHLLLFLLAGTLVGLARPAAEAADPTKAVEGGTASNRLSVAILGFENKTGDPEAAHWREAARTLIVGQLREVKALRMAPGVDYALRQVQKKEGDPIDEAEARKAGEMIEARRVVWGDYRRQGESWLVTVRVLNVATASASKELSAAGGDWFDIRDKLVEQVLKDIGVNPTEDEQQKMRRRFTTSTAALEWLSKGYALSDEGKPEAEVETCVRRALEAEPKCAEAYTLLAAALGTEGKLEEAEKAAREAVKLRPDYAGAHQTLGVAILIQSVSSSEKRFDEADSEFMAAARLDPDDAGTFARRAELYGAQDLRSLENYYRKKALQLDPFSAATHARLGLQYAEQGKREQATAELKEAERLSAPDDMNTEQMLSSAYSALREVPAAISHHERFISLASSRGLNPRIVQRYQTDLLDFKARLTPASVEAARPKDYTEQSLADALRQKLTQEELALVTDPLARTPDMDHWAREIAVGATNELEKAQMLFDRLSRRLNTSSLKGGERTAKEVFAVWNMPGVNLFCEDLTCLYLALARATGLQAHFVLVSETCDGNKVPHACAALFVGQKVLLVDPAYCWFGAPHKKFTVLDDVQAISARLAESDQLKQVQIACKLCPDLALAQFNLFFRLSDGKRWDEARQAMTEVQRLAPQGWMANEVQGSWALSHDGDLKQAEAHFVETRQMVPEESTVHLLLGQTYAQQGKLREARESLRNALRYIIGKDNAEKARRAIARINETIGND